MIFDPFVCDGPEYERLFRTRMKFNFVPDRCFQERAFWQLDRTVPQSYLGRLSCPHRMVWLESAMSMKNVFGIVGQNLSLDQEPSNTLRPIPAILRPTIALFQP